MIIKINNEGNKIIASNLKYNPIDDQMDIMNRQRENMTVKVIDALIKENDQSHQNVGHKYITIPKYKTSNYSNKYIESTYSNLFTR